MPLSAKDSNEIMVLKEQISNTRFLSVALVSREYYLRVRCLRKYSTSQHGHNICSCTI